MICPKYGKNSRGIEKCMARDGRCNEQHSDRECRIKPIKREGAPVTQQPQQPNPNELLLITREELDRCCNQMSAAGYKVSANYVEASVLSRSRPASSPDAIQETAMRMYSLMLEVKKKNTNDFMVYYEERMHEFQKALGIRTGGEP